MNLNKGMIIAAIAVNGFLLTGEKISALYEFHEIMKKTYNIKWLGKTKRFLGRYFNYAPD